MSTSRNSSSTKPKGEGEDFLEGLEKNTKPGSWHHQPPGPQGPSQKSAGRGGKPMPGNQRDQGGNDELSQIVTTGLLVTGSKGQRKHVAGCRNSHTSLQVSTAMGDSDYYTASEGRSDKGTESIPLLPYSQFGRSMIATASSNHLESQPQSRQHRPLQDRPYPNIQGYQVQRAEPMLYPSFRAESVFSNDSYQSDRKGRSTIYATPRYPEGLPVPPSRLDSPPQGQRSPFYPNRSGSPSPTSSNSVDLHRSQHTNMTSSRAVESDYLLDDDCTGVCRVVEQVVCWCSGGEDYVPPR